MSKIIFCGRGPSSPLHIGHIHCYQKISKYATDNKRKILFQFSSDQKYQRDGCSLEFYKKQVKSDLKILSVIFRNNDVFFFDSLRGLDYNLFFKRRITTKLNYFLPNFNLKNSSKVSDLFYPVIQGNLPIILKEWGVQVAEIFTGTDQNPYFEFTRKIDKNTIIELKEIESIPSLKEPWKKMTSSVKKDCIFVNEKPKEVLKKILKSSSGATSKDLHYSNGLLNPEIDFSYTYLTTIGEDNTAYSSGKMNSKEVKLEIANRINKQLHNLNKATREVTSRKLRLFNRKKIHKWLVS